MSNPHQTKSKESYRLMLKEKSVGIGTVFAMATFLSFGCGTTQATDKPNEKLSFGFGHVGEAGADRYIVKKVNIRKYSEWQNPPVTYWGPASNKYQAILTQRFSIGTIITSAHLKANLASFNFGLKPANFAGQGEGGCSLWASKDGKNWVRLLANPTPAELDSYKAFDGLLPAEVLGGTELSIEFRAVVGSSQNGRYTVAQFSRSTSGNNGDIFRIKINESEKAKGPVVQPESSFENTLGMKFVPVPGTDVQFCIWETRVQDYAAYAAANEGVNTKWKRGPGFGQTPTCPVVWVDWNEARAFCAWLTKKEQAAGKLKPGQRYRLPTDAEWSVAVGLGKETGNTPEEKNGGIKGVYPWGNEHPAPQGAGNYYGSMRVDRFSWTSPVGSFAANELGIHDLGGNVWEWCEDKITPTSPLRVMRGLSWHNYAIDSGSLLSSVRGVGPLEKTGDVYGFRVVLEMPQPDVLTKGLVAYYPFNAKAKDESGNGHDGKVKGLTLTQDRHSNAGSAYEVTGKIGSKIEIPESDTLKLQKMTLNAWVYLSKVGGDEPWVILAVDHSFQWAIDNTGKLGARNFFGLNTGGFGKWENLQYKGRIPAGKWFMYTATYDGITMKQYLNSSEVCSLPFSEAVPYGFRYQKEFMVIGTPSSRGSFRNNISNKLDDVRIYDRALSGEEIKVLYKMEKP
jgi:hypothetical protein